ncbi:MAG: PIG-L family deacetylase [Caldilineales bacterium]
MILAPHPDDEVLAAGGLIITAMAAASPHLIRIVVATDGDASYATAWLNGHSPFSHRSFQRMAAERREESQTAVAALGLPPEQVHFWGFPDRGLEPMWQDCWNRNTPYRSRTTGRSASVANGNGRPVPYCGSALLSMLGRELADFRPNVLVMPHPRDAHSDHRALANFAFLAVNIQRTQSDTAIPDMLAYMVWGGSFFRGSARPERDAVSWEHLTLTPDVLAQKARALKCYRSQARPLGFFLRHRARRSAEVFARLQPSAASHE